MTRKEAEEQEHILERINKAADITFDKGDLLICFSATGERINFLFKGDVRKINPSVYAAAKAFTVLTRELVGIDTAMTFIPSDSWVY